MNKILFVCARFPWPLLTGDALRAYNQIRVLSEKNVVDVFSVEKPFASQGDINKYLNVISSGKITKLRKIYNILSHSKDTALQCAMYYDQQSWQELRKLIITNKYNIVIFQLVRLEYLIQKMANLRNELNLDIKIYCDFVDALSLNMRNRATTESFFMKKLCQSESQKLTLIENKIYETIDGSMIISERDANYIGKDSFDIVPNGVAIPERNANLIRNPDKKNINLAFWGNMSYYPNVKAALYLADLYSDLEKGKYKLHIIGAQPNKKIQSLNSRDGIIIHGYVENLNSLLFNMDLAVFPIFDGSGLQNKVLEAFALNIPVITTNIVLDSMPRLKQYAMAANNKEDFRYYIESFDACKDFTEHENSSAVQVLKEHYNWDLINNIIGSK